MQLGVKTFGLSGAGLLGIGIPSENGGVDCSESFSVSKGRKCQLK